MIGTGLYTMLPAASTVTIGGVRFPPFSLHILTLFPVCFSDLHHPCEGLHNLLGGTWAAGHVPTPGNTRVKTSINSLLFLVDLNVCIGRRRYAVYVLGVSMVGHGWIPPVSNPITM